MPTSSSTKTPSRSRKRGGQPGNKNALRHGLYAKRITRAEDDVLSRMKTTHLAGEINYLRVLCGRIAKILENNGLESEATRAMSERTLTTLNTLDRTLSTLLTFIREYAFLTGEKDELDADLAAGQEMARKELGVYQYLDPTPE